jgi:hypothetical protein
VDVDAEQGCFVFAVEGACIENLVLRIALVRILRVLALEAR